MRKTFHTFGGVTQFAQRGQKNLPREVPLCQLGPLMKQSCEAEEMTLRELILETR